MGIGSALIAGRKIATPLIHGTGTGTGGPAQSIVYGTFTGPNSVTTQDVTAPGFTPGLVLMWTNQMTAAGASSTGVPRLTFGAAIPGGNKWSMAASSEDTADPMDTRHIFRSDQAFASVSGTTETQEGLIDTLTGITGGFRVNWFHADASIVHYLAFPNNLDIAVGTYDMQTSTGTQAITGLSFQPKIVMMGSSLIDSATEAAAATFSIRFGAATSSTSRVAATWYDRDASASAVSKGLITASGVVIGTTGSAANIAADLDSMDSGGFTIDVTTAPSSATRIGYVAIGGSKIDVNVGTFLSKASTTGNLGYTGVGFQPTAMLYFGRGPTALDTLQGAMQISMGAATSTTSRGYVAAGSSDGSSAANCARALSVDKAYGVIGGTSSSPDQQADLVSFDSDGWTFNWDAVTASQTYNGYIAMRYTP